MVSAMTIAVSLVVLSAGAAVSAEPFATPAASTVSRTDSGGAKAPAAVPSAATSNGQKSGNPSTSKSEHDDASPFGAFATSTSRGPVNIQSDSLSLDYKNNSVMFRGHVRASQADGELTCNTLEVKYGKDFHEVQQMICNDDVRISQGVRWCTGDRGVLNQTVHTVVLTGNPVCHDTNDQIAGNRITMHLDSGRSEVEAAKAVIFPRPSKTRDNEASIDHVK
jgi:lipopolysaccharide transport protein LptA